MPPLSTDRIRLLLSKTGSVTDYFTGQPPQITRGTDVNIELAFTFGNGQSAALIDASQLATIVCAVKPANDIDASPIFQTTITPNGVGWNNNPVLSAGNNATPAGAQYTAAEAASCGVQLGANYSWQRGANDLSCSNGGVLVAGSSVVPGMQSYVAGAGNTYTLTGLTSGAIYLWQAGSINDTGVTGPMLTSGYFVQSGSTLTLTTSIAAVSIAGPYSSGSCTASGFAIGAWYIWTPGAHDTAIQCGSTILTAAVYPFGAAFQASATTATLSGSSTVTATITPLVTASVIQVTKSASVVPNGAAYSLGPTLLASGVAYSSGGSTVVSGLVVGQWYKWTKGAADTNITCGATTLTSTGYFSALATTATLTGTVSTAASASLQLSSYSLTGFVVGQWYYWTVGQANAVVNYGAGVLSVNGFFQAAQTSVIFSCNNSSAISDTLVSLTVPSGGQFTAASTTVALTGIASASVTASITGNVGFQQGSDQHCIVSFSANTTALNMLGLQKIGMWLVVSATTTGGKQIVLGAGTINLVDDGTGGASGGGGSGYQFKVFYNVPDAGQYLTIPFGQTANPSPTMILWGIASSDGNPAPIAGGTWFGLTSTQVQLNLSGPVPDGSYTVWLIVI